MSDIVSRSQIERSKKEEKFVLLTAEQIRKDFAMFGMDVYFSGNIHFAYDELFKQLNKYIDQLLNENSEKLMSLLYQIDLGEKELARNDNNYSFETVSELITHKVLERELKKVLIRTYFKEKGTT